MPVSTRPGRVSSLRLLGALACLLAGSAGAFAQAIDLSTPHGNAAGCVSRDKQTGGEEDDNVYLTQNALVTAGTACTFVQTLTAPDNALVITALCSIEGEEGRSINQISVVRSKTNATALAVFDEYGALLSEVTPCP